MRSIRISNIIIGLRLPKEVQFKKRIQHLSTMWSKRKKKNKWCSIPIQLWYYLTRKWINNLKDNKFNISICCVGWYTQKILKHKKVSVQSVSQKYYWYMPLKNYGAMYLLIFNYSNSPSTSFRKLQWNGSISYYLWPSTGSVAS